jgi:lysophospholipase L1-like esterase
MDAPIPRTVNQNAKGSAMLYPVYSWIRPSNAASFEIQVFSDDPDKNPSLKPVGDYMSPIAEFYDPAPRMGPAPFYWRVRSLDESGKPIGNWSKSTGFRTSPTDKWEIAVFGDSISHGGGHISFGPEDLEYSWLTYLDNPAVNLSQSGNLTSDMLARFEQDVVPFHPKYLLIMGGSNDLRSYDYSVESAMQNMDAIEKKCREHGIRPIFLTIPPVNTANIKRAFSEPTDPAWKEKFARFNEFLRQKPHIDVAKSFAAYSSEKAELPEWLGYDGLHEDIIGKQLIAARINADWENAVQAADEWFEQQ